MRLTHAVLMRHPISGDDLFFAAAPNWEYAQYIADKGNDFDREMGLSRFTPRFHVGEYTKEMEDR